MTVSAPSHTPLAAIVALAVACHSVALNLGCEAARSAAPPAVPEAADPVTDAAFDQPTSIVSLEDVASALPLVPTGGEDRLRVGRALLNSSHFADAELVMTALGRDFPADARIEFLLGLSIHKQQRYGRARECYLHAKSMEGEFPERMHLEHFLGWAEYHLGNMQPAADAFAEHVRRAADADDSWFGLGAAQLELDAVDESERSLKRALEVCDGKNPIDLRQRAKIVARLGDIALRRDRLGDAAQMYAQAVEMWPDHYEVWERLARVRSELSLPQEAEAARASAEAARQRLGRSATVP